MSHHAVMKMNALGVKYKMLFLCVKLMHNAIILLLLFTDSRL